MRAAITLRVLALLSFPLARVAAAQSAAPDPHALFLKNCATCHGETGDGQGTTQLDRPARSFKDGGFSFGNTPETLFRTLSVGIPGTPMPAFEESLSVAERECLAAYVITLGPPVEEVTSEETILAVHERPAFVRGLLPALVEGGERWPRGLLVGTPDGMTFEYRADDVRLLGVRQGAFVARTDWSGRGGTPLEPLGKLVHVVEAGNPEPAFWLAADTSPVAVQAHLRSTCVAGRDARVAYDLVSGGRPLASVEESPCAVSTAQGAGFARHFVLTGTGAGDPLWMRLFTAGEQDVAGSGACTAEGTPAFWCVVRREGGVFEWIALRTVAPMDLHLLPVGGYAAWKPAKGERIELELTTLLLASWSDDVERELATSLLR